MLPGQRTAEDLALQDLPAKEEPSSRNRPVTTMREDFLAMTARRFVRPAITVNDSLASAWNEALCCEARNSLQVVLSGAEILMEDHLGNLQPAQKALLAKMTDNAYHLCHLIATLTGPDEFKCEQIADGDITTLPRALTKS